MLVASAWISDRLTSGQIALFIENVWRAEAAVPYEVDLPLNVRHTGTPSLRTHDEFCDAVRVDVRRRSALDGA
jgi:hypothetical protein